MRDGVNILLVDDDEDCRLLIKDAIMDGRVENAVYEVGSGEEALDFLYRRGVYADAPRPGLIYLDIMMPGLSGQEVLRELRGDREFSDIPVVMMTSLEDDREKEMAAKNGANSYTVKPKDPLEFIKTVMEATDYWINVHERPGRSGETGLAKRRRSMKEFQAKENGKTIGISGIVE